MRALSDCEKHIAKLARMDQVFQASAEMVRRIESTATLGCAAIERAFQDSAVAPSMAWAKNATFTDEILRSAAAAERSIARSSMIFLANDRTGTKLAMEAFLQSERSLGEAMVEIEKRTALIGQVARRAEGAHWIPHELRAMRNLAVHRQELTVEDDADQPLSGPHFVDVEKNLDAIERAQAVQQDFMEQNRTEAESMGRDLVSRAPHPPGTRMMEIAEAVFTVQDVDLVFEPLVVDYRMDMHEAVRAGDIAKQYALQAEYRTRFVYAIVQITWSAFARAFQAIRGS